MALASPTPSGTGSSSLSLPPNGNTAPGSGSPSPSPSLRNIGEESVPEAAPAPPGAALSSISPCLQPNKSPRIFDSASLGQGETFVDSLQLQFPFLTNQVVAEAMVRLFLYQPESGPLIDPVGSAQHTLRPENDLPVSGRIGEAQALRDQCFAQSHSSRARLHKQQPQLGSPRFLGMLDQEDVSH